MHSKLTRARPNVRAVVVAAQSMVLAIVMTTAAMAQTLTDPTPSTKSSSPPAAAITPTTGRAKSCSQYGAGFIYIPATDGYIKIGGSMTVEGSGRR